MSGSFADVRAVIESKVFAAYGALTPAVPVIADNTFETFPGNLPCVICLISYISTTESVLCPDGGAVERLLGNLQLSCYAPRAQGMKALEEMAAEGMKVMNTMYDATATTKVKCGQVNGPTPILAGDEPYALATISCSFSASVI